MAYLQQLLQMEGRPVLSGIFTSSKSTVITRHCCRCSCHFYKVCSSCSCNNSSCMNTLQHLQQQTQAGRERRWTEGVKQQPKEAHLRRGYTGAISLGRSVAQQTPESVCVVCRSRSLWCYQNITTIRSCVPSFSLYITRRPAEAPKISIRLSGIARDA